MQGLEPTEKSVLAALGPLGIEDRPFEALALGRGMTEKRLLAAIGSLRRRGVIRRFGAFVNHTKVGFRANALVVWRVKKAKADSTAVIFSSFDEVSHCYLRETARGWPYSLYTMVHAADRRKCSALIKKMSKASGIADFKVLFTRRELKKTRLDINAILGG